MKRTASLMLLIFSCVACNPKDQESKNINTDTIVKPDNVYNNKYISQDSIKSFILHQPVVSLPAFSAKPFDSIRFDKVIAYDFDGSDKEESGIIDREGRFAPFIKEQRGLDPSQVSSIISCLSSKQSYGAGTAPCFRPGMAIVFFQNNSPVMTVDICLDCNFLESSLRIPAKYGKKISRYGTEIELTGFSTEGRRCIISLAGQLKFSYAKEKAEY
jgi:hypothetical protein